jgi:hypothetical protein
MTNKGLRLLGIYDSSLEGRMQALEMARSLGEPYCGALTELHRCQEVYDDVLELYNDRWDRCAQFWVEWPLPYRLQECLVNNLLEPGEAYWAARLVEQRGKVEALD